MLRYFLILPLIFCVNIFADVSLSSPKIKLNDKDQRIIEFKIENESINDGDIILNEYKTNNPIDESFIAYTLINDYGNYQTFTIVLDDEYLEDYFSFKILIKENFAKDIFIYLPSKVRNTFNNSKPYKPERISSETTFSLAKSRNVVSNKVEQAEKVERVEKVEPEIQEIEIIKGSEITTVWSMAEKIKSQNQDISIYQIMWSIYLGNSEAFIDENINLIRKDIDISIPTQSEMRQVSLEFAKESFIEMNESFSKRFSSASKSLLVLTAPKNAEIDQKETTDIEKNEERSISTDDNFAPEDFIENNTKELGVNISAESAEELLEKVEDSKEETPNTNFQLMDIIFISLISLISGILLALIYINFRKIKDSKTSIDYDFDEPKEDNSKNIMPVDLSVENDESQQQLDLAVMYIEMDDFENAKLILKDLIKKTNDESILNNANILLDKIQKA
ncbi:hypothetical protein OA499_03400 [Gammaproteobacteria bacterium]|nr:hypothetical protein [Gammaproteobacteria bacterium]